MLLTIGFALWLGLIVASARKKMLYLAVTITCLPFWWGLVVTGQEPLKLDPSGAGGFYLILAGFIWVSCFILVLLTASGSEILDPMLRWVIGLGLVGSGVGYCVEVMSQGFLALLGPTVLVFAGIATLPVIARRLVPVYGAEQVYWAPYWLIPVGVMLASPQTYW